MLAVVRCERREEMAEFLGRLGVESMGCPAAGVGERHAQRSPVPWHGGPPDEAAPFCSVYQAGERGLLHAETLSQFSHPPGAEGQDAQKLGLDGSQVVTFGDARVNALHQAGKLDKTIGVVGMVVRAGVLSIRFAPLPGCHHGGGGSLRGLVHGYYSTRRV